MYFFTLINTLIFTYKHHFDVGFYKHLIFFYALYMMAWVAHNPNKHFLLTHLSNSYTSNKSKLNKSNAPQSEKTFTYLIKFY